METVALSEIHCPPVWAPSPSLSDVLLKPPPRGLDSFAVVPSNVRAVEAGVLFTNGLVSMAAIVGPSGWGKSHLLESVANRIGIEKGPRCCELWSAVDWLRGSRNKSIGTALILDNVLDAMERPRARQQLRLALERRVKAGWATFLAFTESRVTRSIRGVLPSVREWNVVTIREPDAAEREVVLSHMAQAEGVHLAPELRKILAHRLDGNGRTLAGALKRLRLAGAAWASPRDVLRACGLLNPFFSANSAWDLRDHVLEMAGQLSPSELAPSRQELAVYAMLRVAQLSENDVARYLKLDPGRTYAMAQQAECALRDGGPALDRADRFVERIVATLQPS